MNEALSQFTTAPFDVLISDLNIGHPGDGFTVVSAMRRTQPTCITLILTGYPGFDSAVEAIRSQVDDYLIKPAPIPILIKLIEQKLQNPKPDGASATKRISQLLREETFEITQRALNEMKSDPALEAIPLTDEQRIEFVPRTLEDLATMLESAEPEQTTAEVLPLQILNERVLRGESLRWTSEALALKFQLAGRLLPLLRLGDNHGSNLGLAR